MPLDRFEGLSGLVGVQDEWEDLGPFERNKRTGELRVKQKPEQMLGLIDPGTNEGWNELRQLGIGKKTGEVIPSDLLQPGENADVRTLGASIPETNKPYEEPQFDTTNPLAGPLVSPNFNLPGFSGLSGLLDLSEAGVARVQAQSNKTLEMLGPSLLEGLETDVKRALGLEATQREDNLGEALVNRLPRNPMLSPIVSAAKELGDRFGLTKGMTQKERDAEIAMSRGVTDDVKYYDSLMEMIPRPSNAVKAGIEGTAAQLALVSAISALSRSPKATFQAVGTLLSQANLSAFGLQTEHDTREKALKNGRTREEADVLGVLAGGIEAVLEGVGTKIETGGLGWIRETGQKMSASTGLGKALGAGLLKSADLLANHGMLRNTILANTEFLEEYLQGLSGYLFDKASGDKGATLPSASETWLNTLLFTAFGLVTNHQELASSSSRTATFLKALETGERQTDFENRVKAAMPLDGSPPDPMSASILAQEAERFKKENEVLDNYRQIISAIKNGGTPNHDVHDRFSGFLTSLNEGALTLKKQEFDFIQTILGKDESGVDSVHRFIADHDLDPSKAGEIRQMATQRLADKLGVFSQEEVDSGAISAMPWEEVQQRILEKNRVVTSALMYKLSEIALSNKDVPPVGMAAESSLLSDGSTIVTPSLSPEEQALQEFWNEVKASHSEDFELYMGELNKNLMTRAARQMTYDSSSAGRWVYTAFMHTLQREASSRGLRLTESGKAALIPWVNRRLEEAAVVEKVAFEAAVNDLKERGGRRVSSTEDSGLVPDGQGPETSAVSMRDIGEEARQAATVHIQSLLSTKAIDFLNTSAFVEDGSFDPEVLPVPIDTEAVASDPYNANNEPINWDGLEEKTRTKLRRVSSQENPIIRQAPVVIENTELAPDQVEFIQAVEGMNGGLVQQWANSIHKYLMTKIYSMSELERNDVFHGAMAVIRDKYIRENVVVMRTALRGQILEQFRAVAAGEKTRDDAVAHISNLIDHMSTRVVEQRALSAKSQLKRMISKSRKRMSPSDQNRILDGIFPGQLGNTSLDPFEVYEENVANKKWNVDDPVYAWNIHPELLLPGESPGSIAFALEEVDDVHTPETASDASEIIFDLKRPDLDELDNFGSGIVSSYESDASETEGDGEAESDQTSVEKQGLSYEDAMKLGLSPAGDDLSPYEEDFIQRSILDKISESLWSKFAELASSPSEMNPDGNRISRLSVQRGVVREESVAARRAMLEKLFEGKEADLMKEYLASNGADVFIHYGYEGKEVKVKIGQVVERPFVRGSADAEPDREGAYGREYSIFENKFVWVPDKSEKNTERVRGVVKELVFDEYLSDESLTEGDALALTNKLVDAMNSDDIFSLLTRRMGEYAKYETPEQAAIGLAYALGYNIPSGVLSSVFLAGNDRVGEVVLTKSTDKYSSRDDLRNKSGELVKGFWPTETKPFISIDGDKVYSLYQGLLGLVVDEKYKKLYFSAVEAIASEMSIVPYSKALFSEQVVPILRDAVNRVAPKVYRFLTSRYFNKNFEDDVAQLVEAGLSEAEAQLSIIKRYVDLYDKYMESTKGEKSMGYTDSNSQFGSIANKLFPAKDKEEWVFNRVRQMFFDRVYIGYSWSLNRPFVLREKGEELKNKKDKAYIKYLAEKGVDFRTHEVMSLLLPLIENSPEFLRGMVQFNGSFSLDGGMQELLGQSASDVIPALNRALDHIRKTYIYPELTGARKTVRDTRPGENEKPLEALIGRRVESDRELKHVKEEYPELVGESSSSGAASSATVSQRSEEDDPDEKIEGRIARNRKLARLGRAVPRYVSTAFTSRKTLPGNQVKGLDIDNIFFPSKDPAIGQTLPITNFTNKQVGTVTRLKGGYSAEYGTAVKQTVVAPTFAGLMERVAKIHREQNESRGARAFRSTNTKKNRHFKLNFVPTAKGRWEVGFSDPVTNAIVEKIGAIVYDKSVNRWNIESVNGDRLRGSYATFHEARRRVFNARPDSSLSPADPSVLLPMTIVTVMRRLGSDRYDGSSRAMTGTAVTLYEVLPGTGERSPLAEIRHVVQQEVIKKTTAGAPKTSREDIVPYDDDSFGDQQARDLESGTKVTVNRSRWHVTSVNPSVPGAIQKEQFWAKEFSSYAEAEKFVLSRLTSKIYPAELETEKGKISGKNVKIIRESLEDLRPARLGVYSKNTTLAMGGREFSLVNSIMLSLWSVYDSSEDGSGGRKEILEAIQQIHAPALKSLDDDSWAVINRGLSFIGTSLPPLSSRKERLAYLSAFKSYADNVPSPVTLASHLLRSGRDAEEVSASVKLVSHMIRGLSVKLGISRAELWAQIGLYSSTPEPNGTVVANMKTTRWATGVFNRTLKMLTFYGKGDRKRDATVALHEHIHALTPLLQFALNKGELHAFDEFVMTKWEESMSLNKSSWKKSWTGIEAASSDISLVSTLDGGVRTIVKVHRVSSPNPEKGETFDDEISRSNYVVLPPSVSKLGDIIGAFGESEGQSSTTFILPDGTKVTHGHPLHGKLQLRLRESMRVSAEVIAETFQQQAVGMLHETGKNDIRKFATNASLVRALTEVGELGFNLLFVKGFDKYNLAQPVAIALRKIYTAFAKNSEKAKMALFFDELGIVDQFISKYSSSDDRSAMMRQYLVRTALGARYIWSDFSMRTKSSWKASSLKWDGVSRDPSLTEFMYLMGYSVYRPLDTDSIKNIDPSQVRDIVLEGMLSSKNGKRIVSFMGENPHSGFDEWIAFSVDDVLAKYEAFREQWSREVSSHAGLSTKSFSPEELSLLADQMDISKSISMNAPYAEKDVHDDMMRTVAKFEGVEYNLEQKNTRDVLPIDKWRVAVGDEVGGIPGRGKKDRRLFQILKEQWEYFANHPDSVATLGNLTAPISALFEKAGAKSVAPIPVKNLSIETRSEWYQNYMNGVKKRSADSAYAADVVQAMLINIGGIANFVRRFAESKPWIYDSSVSKFVPMRVPTFAQMLSRIPPEFRSDVGALLMSKRTLEMIEQFQRRVAKLHREASSIRALGVRGEISEAEVDKRITELNRLTDGADRVPQIPEKLVQDAALTEAMLRLKYGSAFENVEGMARGLVSWMRDVTFPQLEGIGKLTPEQSARLRAASPWFLPMWTAKEEADLGSVFTSYADPLDPNDPKHSNLEDRLFMDPFDQIAETVARTLAYVERQRMKNTIIGTMMNSDPETRAAFDRHFEPAMVEEEAMRILDVPLSGASTGKRRSRAFNRYDYYKLDKAAKSRYFSVFSDGQQVWYKIKTWEMEHAFKYLDGMKQFQWETGGLAKFFKSLVGWSSGMAVSSLSFASRVLFRDVANAAVRTQAGWGAGGVMMIPDLIYGMYQQLPALIPGLGEMFPEAFAVYNYTEQGMAKQGIMAGFFEENLALELHKLVSAAGTDQHPMAKEWRKIWTGLTAPVGYRFFQKHNIPWASDVVVPLLMPVRMAFGLTRGIVKYFEGIPRVGETRLKAKGYTGRADRLKNTFAPGAKGLFTPIKGKDLSGVVDPNIDAANREVTLNFDQKGLISPVLSHAYLFANPEVIDTFTNIKMFKKDPVVFGLMALSFHFVPRLLNYLWHRDDEDWTRQSWIDKFGYYHLYKFDDGSFFKIPTAVGVTATIFNGMADLLYVNGLARKDKDPMFDVGQISSGMLNSGNSVIADRFVAGTMLKFMPVVAGTDPMKNLVGVGPVVQAMMNEDWRGQKIDKQAGMYGSVSPHARTLGSGEAFNSIAEALYRTHPKLDVAPAMLQHFVASYIPYWGNVAAKVVASEVLGADVKMDDKSQANLPPSVVMGPEQSAQVQASPGNAQGFVEKALSGLSLLSKPAIGYRSTPVLMYMEHYRKMGEVWADIRRANPEMAGKYVENYPLIRVWNTENNELLKQTWDRHYAQLQDVFKLRREILASKTMGEEEKKYKVYEIDLWMTRETNDFLANAAQLYMTQQDNPYGVTGNWLREYNRRD